MILFLSGAGEQLSWGFGLRVPQEVAVRCQLGPQFLDASLGLKFPLPGWLSHIEAWRVHPGRWREASVPPLRAPPWPLCSLVANVALGILQEQMAQRENRREPQCLGVGHQGRGPFPPYSVCSSESVCSAQARGQVTGLSFRRKNVKGFKTTTMHFSPSLVPP